MKKLLELRKEKNKKKPQFVRQDYSRKIALKKKWIKPRGLHSKMRLKKRGKGHTPSRGYSSPKKTKHLTNEGLKIIIISNISEITKVRPNVEAIKINSKIGNKKRLLLLEKLKNTGVKIINFKNPNKKIEDIKKELEERKKQKKVLKKKETQSKDKTKETEKKETQSKDKTKETEKKETQSKEESKK